MKKLLLSIILVSVCQPVSLNAMTKYFQWAAKREEDAARKEIEENKSLWGTPLHRPRELYVVEEWRNKSLQELLNDLDRKFYNRVLIKYFVAPAACVIAVPTLLYLHSRK
jgi:hypothetical protein